MLKHYGKRVQTQYQPMSLSGADPSLSGESVPVSVPCGGVVLFVLDVSDYKRY